MIEGANGAVLELANLQASATGVYSVELANAVGRVTSEPVIVRVAPPGSPGGGGVTYLRSEGGRPWDSSENEMALDRVFSTGPGAEGWTQAFFESANVSSLLAQSRFVFAEGSFLYATNFSTFLATHRQQIEQWVAGGGHLFLNCAPNGTSSIDLGFGGVRLVEIGGGASSGVALGQHRVFLGPAGDAGRSWTGGSFAHAELQGDHFNLLIVSEGRTVLGELSWGAGLVLFGTMTTPNFHQPYVGAANLRANLLAYGGERAVVSPEIVYVEPVPPDTLRAYLSLSPSRIYRVEYSSDLRQWTPLHESVSAPSGALRVDLPAGESNARYLRATELGN